MRIRSSFIILMMWLCAACAPAPQGQTVYIDDAAPDITHTLDITISAATTSTGQPVSGHLVLTSRRHGDTRRLTITSSGPVTPNWLTPFGGALSIITTPTATWHVDDGCVRDGSMLPSITMRDIFGPLSGFIAAGTVLRSQSGGTAWTQFSATAQTTADGSLTTMTGDGRGKILVPGGIVVTGAIAWTYGTQIDVTPIVLPPRCNDAVFADMPIPDNWHNRRPYGGAMLAESSLSLGDTQQELLQLLLDKKWQAQVMQADTQVVVIHASYNNETVQLFLVSNEHNGVDITMIVQS